MIEDEKQYAVTLEQVKVFSEAIAYLEKSATEDEAARAVQLEGMRSQLQSLRDEVAVYEQKKAGILESTKLLGDAFIEAKQQKLRSFEASQRKPVDKDEEKA